MNIKDVIAMTQRDKLRGLGGYTGHNHNNTRQQQAQQAAHLHKVQQAAQRQVGGQAPRLANSVINNQWRSVRYTD